MISLGIAADEPGLTTDERRWRRETRSSLLRLAVLVILIVNLLAGEHGGNLLVHTNVLLGYSLATVMALGLAVGRRGPAWSGTLFVIIDALAVVALFHEHLYGPSGTLDHSLTTTSLAIAFLLLTHVALHLRPQLVLLFAATIVVGWLSLLVFRVLQQPTHAGENHPLSILITDAALAAAFGFAAFLVYLLTQDHNALLKGAMKSERRRHNLSRFFSPALITELQGGPAPLALERRDAAVMFVDLRGFSRFAETAQPRELAELLAEYRQRVARASSTGAELSTSSSAMESWPYSASLSPDLTTRSARCAAPWKSTLY
jgi:adenylate cyclase